MTTEYLRKQLEIWKQWALVSAGAAATLLVTAIGDRAVNSYITEIGGWFAVWFIIQVGAIPAGLTLLISSEWRKLPLTERLNPAFAFLAVSWTGWLALLIHGSGTPLVNLAFLLLPLGVALPLVHVGLRRRATWQAEELFP